MKESKPIKIPPPHQDIPPEKERRNPFEESDDITPHDIPIYDPSKEGKRGSQ